MLLKDIKPNPKNPRTISEAALEKLKDSIHEFPKMMALRPIIVDKNNMVLGGNQRLAALEMLGFTEIPDEWVKCAADLTKKERERFVIADNISFGEFDWDILQTDWQLENLQDWGLDTEAFDMPLDAPKFNDMADPDSTNSFTTDIMLIRNDIARKIEHDESVNLSDAYLMAESFIIKRLRESEYFTN